MTKADFKILERIFASEMQDHPAQIKSKRLPELEADGLVYQAVQVLPGRFPVIIKGWGLTPRGHIAFCQACADTPDL